MEQRLEQARDELEKLKGQAEPAEIRQVEREFADADLSLAMVAALRQGSRRRAHQAEIEQGRKDRRRRRTRLAKESRKRNRRS